MDEIASFLTPFATALLGALVGALSAYWLARAHEKRNEKQRQNAALIKAQFALHGQWNTLEDLRRHVLAEYRDDPDRFTKGPLVVVFTKSHPVDYESISFIGLSKEPNLLQKIHTPKGLSW